MREIRQYMPKLLPGSIALAVSVIVLGCGVVQDSDRLRAPNYASPMGMNNWEVNCGGNRAIIDDDALDEFYNADGSVKTYVEFCREAEPSLIDRAPRPGSNQ